jgi:hypothetical protein
MGRRRNNSRLARVFPTPCSTPESNENYGMGVLSFIDVTAVTKDGDSYSDLPAPEDYKESSMRFMRRIDAGNPATAATIEAKTAAAASGSIPVMKKAPIVFPAYTAHNEEEDTDFQSESLFSSSLCTRTVDISIIDR